MSQRSIFISKCDLFLIFPIDVSGKIQYNDLAMMIQNLILSNESYTHENWIYRDVCVGFSRLYYIIDGTAYYEENGQAHLLKKGYLYITPVKKSFTLYEDPQSKLLHTYAHIVTLPAVGRFTEIEVKDDTPLADAVSLWRKYAKCKDKDLITKILAFVLSCTEKALMQENTVAARTKDYLDRQSDFSLDMHALSKAIGYSREHLTRSFLTAYGTTPKQYLHLQRMNAALEDLTAGQKVGTVAEALQYATPYAFSKAFKKHFGLSPEKYMQTLHTNKKDSSH